MFLSKLVLNPRDAKARRDLVSPYEMHRTILSVGFDGTPKADLGRVLFRADSDPTARTPSVVLIQSSREPTWGKLPTGYAVDVGTKPFDPQFRAGQRLRFRLRANPTKRVAVKNTVLGESLGGKRVGLFKENDQLRWLLRHAESNGFKIPGSWVPATDPETDEPIRLPNFRVDVIPEGRSFNTKAGAGGWFLAVRYEGVLEVTEPIAFRNTIASGIGPAKGFGFGLLSVATA